MIPEAGSEAVTGAGTVRFEYQGKGLGARLKEIVFECLMRQGNYRYAAEIDPDNKISERSLLKVLQKLGLEIKKPIPSWRYPTMFHIIDLFQSARHAI